MNASEILKETMTLEEKLAAIDNAMQVAQEKANEQAKSAGLTSAAPIDPQDLLMCEGCQ